MKDLVEDTDLIHHYLGASIKTRRNWRWNMDPKIKENPHRDSHCRAFSRGGGGRLRVCWSARFYQHPFLRSDAWLAVLYGCRPASRLSALADGCAQLRARLHVHAWRVHRLAVLHQPHLHFRDGAFPARVWGWSDEVTPIIKPYLIALKISEKLQKALPKIAYVLALAALVFAFVGFDILSVADTAMVAATTTTVGNPLAEISAQEPLSTFWLRPLLMFVAGLLIAVASSRPGDKTQFAPREPIGKKLLMPAALLVLTALSTLVRESASESVLLMNGNLRFALSILLSVAFGFVFGAVIEITLIRPLYVRPTFILLMTLGLSYVIRELVQYLWDPLTYQMSRPPLFAQPGKASSIAEWLQKGSSTIDIYGATVPTYRLFIIALGIAMFILVIFVMTKTRLGMIIRAGVQDPQMVEAMGINVKAVFTVVFAMGVALAALGGIGAAPFLPVQPLMGDTYQTQGLITVVIGGMGSYIGAFVGAMILGMARAFGDYFALKLSLSPAIAEASTVIIMVIVLLTRPQGLFGKKE